MVRRSKLKTFLSGGWHALNKFEGAPSKLRLGGDIDLGNYRDCLDPSPPRPSRLSAGGWRWGGQFTSIHGGCFQRLKPGSIFGGALRHKPCSSRSESRSRINVKIKVKGVGQSVRPTWSDPADAETRIPRVARDDNLLDCITTLAGRSE